MQTSHNRFTAGRVLQALAIGKSSGGALSFAEGMGHWTDRGQIVSVLKAAVAAGGTADFPDSNPAAESFLGAMRDYSIPLRLTNLRRVPMRCRLYVSTTGVIAVRVAEGSALPVLRGDWTATTLEPVKHGGVTVVTDELVKSMSPIATVALADDLAQAVAEAENLSFISPDHVGSVLYGAPNFAGTGASISQVDADLLRLAGLVPGAARGGAWVMTSGTATAIALLRGSGGSPAYPGLGPTGGTLLNLPVLVTDACQQVGSPVTRVVGLLSPSEIFWADEGKVAMAASQNALIEMTDAPTGSSLTPTGSTMTSMFQTNSTALKGIRESAWYARPGAGAYYTCGF